MKLFERFQTQFYPHHFKITCDARDRETPIHVVKRGHTVAKCETLSRAQWQVAQYLVA